MPTQKKSKKKAKSRRRTEPPLRLQLQCDESRVARLIRQKVCSAWEPLLRELGRQCGVDYANLLRVSQSLSQGKYRSLGSMERALDDLKVIRSCLLEAIYSFCEKAQVHPWAAAADVAVPSPGATVLRANLRVLDQDHIQGHSYWSASLGYPGNLRLCLTKHALDRTGERTRSVQNEDIIHWHGMLHSPLVMIPTERPDMFALYAHGGRDADRRGHVLRLAGYPVVRIQDERAIAVTVYGQGMRGTPDEGLSDSAIQAQSLVYVDDAGVHLFHPHRMTRLQASLRNQDLQRHPGRNLTIKQEMQQMMRVYFRRDPGHPNPHASILPNILSGMQDLPNTRKPVILAK